MLEKPLTVLLSVRIGTSFRRIDLDRLRSEIFTPVIVDGRNSSSPGMSKRRVCRIFLLAVLLDKRAPNGHDLCVSAWTPVTLRRSK